MSENDTLNSSQEFQVSEFTMCLNSISELIRLNEYNPTVLLSKLAELDMIHQKRMNGFKRIIKGQKEFHNSNNKQVKQSDKEKNALIRELQTEVQNLKDALFVYSNIELKYADAVKQLSALKNKL